MRHRVQIIAASILLSTGQTVATPINSIEQFSNTATAGVVEPDGALLLSYELPGDIFYNYYSKGDVAALAGTSLNNTTVLPVGLK